MNLLPNLPVRAVVALTINEVVNNGRSLTQVLEDGFTYTSESDRSFYKALCYTTIRNYHLLDFWLNKLLQKPLKKKDQDIHLLMLSGLAQIAFLDKPVRVSLNETVEAAKKMGKPWAARLVNGVLRNFQRREEELNRCAESDPCAQNKAPKWLIKRIREAYPEEWSAIFSNLNCRPPMTLRINQSVISATEYLRKLVVENQKGRLCPYTNYGITLDEPCDVAELPGFFESGLCSVQDEAAQLCVQCLDVKPGMRVLDACSAPGGKTAAILEAYPDISEVWALDADPNRQSRTEQTLDRLNLKAKVLVAEAENIDSWWDGRHFDRILLDAPCSATGVIRRHPDIKLLRRDKDIEKLAEIQLNLVNALWKTLKPNGVLVYATCSILPQENAHIIERFLQNNTDAEYLPLSVGWGRETGFGRQLLPQPHGHDGFFYACLGFRK